MAVATQLSVDTSVDAMQMADAMFGTGITVTSASFTGATTAKGVYSNGDATAGDLTPSDSGVILSTGNAAAITNSSGDANVSAGLTTAHMTAGDDDLSLISGQQTYDAAVFEAEFTPEGSTLTMQVVFSSEEYLAYVNSGFNDAVGVWVNGAPATLTVGTGDITINNINDVNNANLYIDNPSGAEMYNTEMEGFTVTLTLKATVIPGQVNTIKIGIADGGDNAYDSNLLIAGNSIQTALIAGDDEIDLIAGTASEVDVLGNDVSVAGGTLTITHINGQPVVVGDTITLVSGEEITLTATGFEVTSHAEEDGGTTFSYTVEDSAGNSDIAFVTVTTTVPCFVAGTLIDTPQGPRAVERIAVGEMVQTLDHGPQPVRWVGMRRLGLAELAAHPALQPIRIGQGALGGGVPLTDLLVSPQHRILVRSAVAWRMFDCEEVLVAAKQLLSLPGITQPSPTTAVTYVHLLFAQHEVVMANGAATESLFTGPEAMKSLGQAARDEISAIFPTLAGRKAARVLVSGKPARALALQHQQKGLALQDRKPEGSTSAPTRHVDRSDQIGPAYAKTHGASPAARRPDFR